MPEPQQLAIFPGAPGTEARARHDDPEPSHQAAADVEASGVAADHRARILAAFGRYAARTCAELAERSGLDYYAVHRRMTELERMGLIRREGVAVCPIRGGKRMVTTWRPTQ